VEPIKNVKTKKGSANLMTYITVYILPCVGLLAASKRIEPNIGPIHGVHPAAKPNPTKNVSKYLTRLFLYCTRFYFINALIFNLPPTKRHISIINILAYR